VKPWKAGLLYAAALALVAGSAIGLRSREGTAAESPVPSVTNAGARGAKALFTYLKESGATVAALERPYTELPPDAQVLVALAPTRRRISPKEADALRAFVERGNTFVYAAPRRVRRQVVDTWLELRWIHGPQPAPVLDTAQLDRGLKSLLAHNPEPSDPTGAQAEVWLPARFLEGVRTLRVAAEDGVETGVEASAAMAGAQGAPFVVALEPNRSAEGRSSSGPLVRGLEPNRSAEGRSSSGPLVRGLEPGEGTVVLLAGGDLAENRRLALGDNLQLWVNLVDHKKVYFDEYHHTAEEPARGLGAALGPLLVQLALCGGALALALGRRFGVARPLAIARRRSQGEYVAQLARLYARSGADAELCAELYRSLRGRLFDRMAISTALDDVEVARRLELRTGVEAERYLALSRRSAEAARSGDRRAFLELSRDFARLENDLGCA
jgi:hypothetical protein